MGRYGYSLGLNFGVWKADSGKGVGWHGWVGYLIYMEFYVGDTYEIK